jgi:hypothetical protein
MDLIEFIRVISKRHKNIGDRNSMPPSGERGQATPWKHPVIAKAPESDLIIITPNKMTFLLS